MSSDKRPSDFVGLSLAERPELFRQISALSPSELPPIALASFAGKPGWIVSSFPEARRILTLTVGVKSRPARSRASLGGVGAAEGDVVRSIKRDLLASLGEISKDKETMRSHLLGAMEQADDPLKAPRLTETLASALVSITTGAKPSEVSGSKLRELVTKTWSGLEDPKGAELEDELFDFLLQLVRDGNGGLAATLGPGGWEHPRITEELRAMLLAGWGSTTALVLSASSLGAAHDLADPRVTDEVLRLYPPSFMIARTIVRRENGLPFELGDTVVISPWLIHRNPAGWARPERFEPSRRETQVGRQWFLPFGIGPRRCPASRFARSQAAIAGRLATPRQPDSTTSIELVENRSPALVSSDD